MVEFRTRVKKVFFLTLTGGSFMAVLIVDAVTWSADIDAQWLTYARHALLAAGFVSLYFLVESIWKRDQSPLKKLGFLLVVGLVVEITSLMFSAVTEGSFDAKNYALIPSGFTSILTANLYGVVFGSTVLIVYLTLRDLVFARRRRGTRRNFLILGGLILFAAGMGLFSRPLETTTLENVLLVLIIVMAVVNSFRLSWIVYLTKREKLFSLIYGFILCAIFAGYSVMLMTDTTIGRALLFYSKPLDVLERSFCLFGAIYFGMTFVSTLFHLPTAEAFDRKTSEVTSLHNLSRLITQVFDFNELVDTVTNMTLEVCEANASWLEIVVPETPAAGIARLKQSSAEPDPPARAVSMSNITADAVAAIMEGAGEYLRQEVVESGKALVIDDCRANPRTRSLAEMKQKVSSLVVVPLRSHAGVIGVLYATKDIEYGFDREDVELISAFADQATIAIENSRLIEKSLERERLMREMLLAQDMQRKLLPQGLPRHHRLEIEALSTPAFEVGGDYYDFIALDASHIGILVGDVSGKGVSAAFYMAEMKGIFQSLSKIYRSPKEFLVRAHEALAATIDKRSFISIVYAVLNTDSGEMRVARAGHCPVLYRTDGTTRYVKPKGMGLGMGTTQQFQDTIVEESLTLAGGDAVVFYTDGVTEAHPGTGDEFGYDRLRSVVEHAGAASAEEIRDAIILAVDEHMAHESPEDDLTIVVLRWKSQVV